MLKTVVEINDIGMTYVSRRGEKVNAIDTINIHAYKGEFVSLVGPSGCGKTTLIRIIAGLLKPTKGTVLIDGKDVSGPTKNIGMVFQSPLLLEWRNILDNILLPIEIKNEDKNNYISRAKDLMNLSDISGFENKSPYELSGGMAQRACICRALITDPPLLLMDEPFSALDSFTRSQMNLELLKIWEGEGGLAKSKKESELKTVIFITHNIQEAVFLSDKVVVLTCRPSKVMNVYKIPFQRPREESIYSDKNFYEIVSKITEDIKSNFNYN
jgi:NitT/TauT family transport system ATP-binding protein